MMMMMIVIEILVSLWTLAIWFDQENPLEIIDSIVGDLHDEEVELMEKRKKEIGNLKKMEKKR